MPDVEAVALPTANCILHVPEAKVSVTVTVTLLLFESLPKAVATHVVPSRLLWEIDGYSSSSAAHPAKRHKAKAARSRISRLVVRAHNFLLILWRKRFAPAIRQARLIIALFKDLSREF